MLTTIARVRTFCVNTQQSWSVLKPLIGLVYLDPRGTRSGPENATFTVVVLLIDIASAFRPVDRLPVLFGGQYRPSGHANRIPLFNAYRKK